MKGVERHPPTVAPAHAAINPGQERCELAVEADVALAAPRDHAATPALTRDKRRSVDRLDPRWSATLPESLFLKALTEGLPMIRPGEVDICRPVMVR